jgi:hypothetical protein
VRRPGETGCFARRVEKSPDEQAGMEQRVQLIPRAAQVLHT